MKPGLHHYFEFLSLVIALYCVNRLRNNFVIWFIPYLFIVFSSELSANYLYYTHGYSTAWIYNFLNLLSHLFYAYIFLNFAIRNSKKVTILFITGTYIIASLIYHFSTSIHILNNYVIASGGIIQVLFACSYFSQYLKDDDLAKDNKYTSGLWLAAGILIFYAGVAICFSLYNYIRFNKLLLFGMPLYNSIPRYLSVILYSSISIALLTWRKQKLI